ncbi:MAG: class I mannose-6-phosphate isomerase [Clostridia bacterium]|nr:class I mannose-6-phosphate isomerase [Clostridia bacterium]
MKKIYRLIPALKDNLWGGNKLRTYGKESEADRIAESWELSFTKGGEAKTEDGRTMSEAFPRECWGKNAEKFQFFPTLTKFIDAREKLSVQVHPSDGYALENEGQYGKTEMWYVVEADEGAGLYMGLNEAVAPEKFRAAVEDGTVEKLLSFKEVRTGDVFFIPSGTIHAIGAGVVIFEIQQNSTLTYRLYDYMRRDKDGNLRELHIEKAMLVSDLDVYKPAPRVANSPEIIGKCEYFETAKYKLNFTNLTLDVTPDSFLSVTCVGGAGEIEGEKIQKGDTFFIPAGAGKITVSGGEGLEIITVKIPKM